MGDLLMELEARMMKILTDQEAQQKLITAGLLSKDPWKWSYTRWDADKKAHCPTEKEPPSCANRIVGATTYRHETPSGAKSSATA